MILNSSWCHPDATSFVEQASLLMQELCRRTFRPSICRMKVQLVGTRAGILQCSGFQFAQTSFDCSLKGRCRVASCFTHESRDVIANRESPSTVCALERRFTQRGHARLGAKTVQNTSSWTSCHVLTRNRFVHSETLHVNGLNAVKPFIRLQDIRNRSVRPDGFFDSWDVRTCFARPLRWRQGRITSVSVSAASIQGGWLSLLGRVDIKLIAQGTFAEIILIVPANRGDWTNTTKTAVLFYHSSLVQSMDVSDGFLSRCDYLELLILLTAKCSTFYVGKQYEGSINKRPGGVDGVRNTWCRSFLEWPEELPKPLEWPLCATLAVTLGVDSPVRCLFLMARSWRHSLLASRIAPLMSIVFPHLGSNSATISKLVWKHFKSITCGNKKKCCIIMM